MDTPRILIGVLTCDIYSYCLNELEQAIKSFSYKNYDVLFIDNSETNGFQKELEKRGFKVIKTKRLEKLRDMLVEGHNILREKALEGKYEYLFLLDADTIPPKDVIERFLKNNKKVISGLYFNPFTFDGKRDYYPLIRIAIPGNKEAWIIPGKNIWGSGELIKIVSAGTGCLFLHKTILEKYKFWYDPTAKGCDDTWFFKSLLDDNVDCFCDTSIICTHLLKNKPVFVKELYKLGKY